MNPPQGVRCDDVEVETITVSDLRRWHQSLEDRDVRWANHPRKEPKPGGLAPRTICPRQGLPDLLAEEHARFSWVDDEDEDEDEEQGK